MANRLLSNPHRLAVVFIALVVVFQACISLQGLYALFLAPHDNTFPESVSVWHALQLSKGVSPYQDFRTSFPSASALYGPMHYYPIAAVVKVFGCGLEGTYLTGRIFSLLAMLGIIAVLIAWCRTERISWLSISAVVLLLLTQQRILTSAVTYRPDAMAAFFSFFAISLFAQKRWRRVGLLLLLLSVFTKQDYICAPLAIVLCWSVQRRFKDIIRTFIPLVSAGIVVFLALTFMTKGHYILNNVSSLVNPYHLSQWFRLIHHALPESLLVACLIVVAAVWQARRSSSDLLVWYFGTSLIVHLVLMGKHGANINYLIEPLLAGMMLVARWLNAAWGGEVSTAPTATAENPPRVLPSCAWACVPVALLLLFNGVDQLKTASRNFIKIERGYQAVENMVRIPDDGLSLVSDPALAVRLGGRPMILDLFHWNLLFAYDKDSPLLFFSFSPSFQVESIQRKEPLYIIYRPMTSTKRDSYEKMDRRELERSFSTALASAIEANYHIDRVVANYVIAVPNR